MEEEILQENTLHCSHQKEEEEGGGGGEDDYKAQDDCDDKE
jgi:hypothetical protein